MEAWAAAVVLVFLALVHSLAGQKKVLAPLLRNPGWSIGLPRPRANILITLAWHLTSVSWLGLAATLVGAPPGLVVGALGTATGAVLFGALRTHVAWPFFLFAGFAALRSAGALPTAAVVATTALCAVTAVGLAVVHVYWAAGGRWGADKVLPRTATGEPPGAAPGPLVTLVVAALLLTYSGSILWPALGQRPVWGWWLTLGAASVLSLRVIGEGTYVGLTKSVRSTEFARLDDAYFTPLAALLAFGAWGSLVL